MSGKNFQKTFQQFHQNENVQSLSYLYFMFFNFEKLYSKIAFSSATASFRISLSSDNLTRFFGGVKSVDWFDDDVVNVDDDDVRAVVDVVVANVVVVTKLLLLELLPLFDALCIRVIPLTPLPPMLIPLFVTELFCCRMSLDWFNWFCCSTESQYRDDVAVCIYVWSDWFIFSPLLPIRDICVAETADPTLDICGKWGKFFLMHDDVKAKRKNRRRFTSS